MPTFTPDVPNGPSSCLIALTNTCAPVMRAVQPSASDRFVATPAAAGVPSWKQRPQVWM